METVMKETAPELKMRWQNKKKKNTKSVIFG